MDQTYAEPFIAIARRHIAALLDGYRDATGLPMTFVARMAGKGDSKFAKTFQTSNFSFGTYDAINSRLSAVWPLGAEWPAGVPRQAPAEIEPEVMAELEARLSKIAGMTSAASAHTLTPKESPTYG